MNALRGTPYARLCSVLLSRSLREPQSTISVLVKVRQVLLGYPRFIRKVQCERHICLVLTRGAVRTPRPCFLKRLRLRGM